MSFSTKKKYDDRGLKNILYIGGDEGYWTTLKKQFELDYRMSSFLYYHYKIDNKEITYKDVFFKTFELMPKIIYVDISNNTHTMLKLCRLFARERLFEKSALIALANSNAEIPDALNSNVDFAHIKCGEIHDVIYGPVRMVFPKEAKEPKFARALTEIKEEVLAPARIGYLTKDYVHLEGDVPLKDEKSYKVSSEIPKQSLPSQSFYFDRVTKNEGNFFQHQYSFNLKPYYKDKPEVLVQFEKSQLTGKKLDVDRQTIEFTKKEYEADLERAEKNFGKWVDQNRADDLQKNIKVYIIDDGYNVLKQIKDDLSSYPYAFRLNSDLNDEMIEIDRIRPEMICINLPNEEDRVEADEEGVLSPMEQQIVKLGKRIRSLDNYSPVVLFFNSDYSSESLTRFMGYSMVVANRKKIRIEVIVDMANMLQTKKEKEFDQIIQSRIARLKKSNPMKFSRLKPTDFKEIKLHVSKRDKLSKAYVHFPIVVVGLNESEIWFRSDFNELAPGHYYLNYPTEVYITLLKDKDTDKLITNLNDKVCYHGVFHGIGEDEKKRIRQAVNKVFFSDLIEQRELESSKFDQMTQEALDAKLQELEKMKRLMELQQVKKKTSNGE